MKTAKKVKNIDWSNYDLKPEYLKYSRYREEKEQKKLIGQMTMLAGILVLIMIFS